MGWQTEATDQTAADYLEHALEDLNQARQGRKPRCERQSSRLLSGPVRCFTSRRGT
jgi:hypothetical protein